MKELRVSLVVMCGCVLQCVTGIDSDNTHTHTHGPEEYTPETPVLPYFTSCVSREQETFRCWWSSGTLSSLKEPGALSVFFKTRGPPFPVWRECPEYTSSVENECFFNKTFTHIWMSYCVQLRSTAQNISYDEYCFSVENIVHPDPPVGLNWTLLNISRSGLNFDILVRWTPPPSADVQMGWMSLKYEVQYRVKNSSHWEKLDLESGTQQSIYGLQTDKEYEVRIHCKMSSFVNFGGFSESIFVHVPYVPSKESVFPMAVLLVFGVVAMLILFVLVIFSQQQRLMVILLPPVPAPKIKGIDPELLKKGKMEQLNSLLSSQPMYNTDVYGEDPWVEFIQLDLDDLIDKSETSDTRRLLGVTRTGLKGDDDSGRDSCYDPDLLPDSEGLLTTHSELEERHLLDRESSTEETHQMFPIQTQPGGLNRINTDFYAQVSDVTPTGGVVLSPEQLQSVTREEKMKKEVAGDGGEEEQKKKTQLQLLVVDSDQVTDSSATCSPPPEDQYHALTPEPGEGIFQGEYLTPEAETQSPYFVAEAAPRSVLPPVSVYTVVQEMDGQHSVLLNPPAPPPSTCSQNPPKTLPPEQNSPLGYLTPELLHNLSP